MVGVVAKAAASILETPPMAPDAPVTQTAKVVVERSPASQPAGKTEKEKH